MNLLDANGQPLTRRNLLRLGLGSLATGGLLLAAEPTPAQTEGPFHPMGGGVDRRLIRWADRDADLTFVDERPGHARGQLGYIHGRVLDEADQPVAGASIEIWQACISGRYNHRSDPSREWLDPEFQYWGRTTSDDQGNYRFRTIIPGAYLAGPGWIRPPHIHFKIARQGYRTLTTQMFFSGVQFYYQRRWYDARQLDNLNAADGVLLGVRQDLRSRVVRPGRRPLATEVKAFEPSSRIFQFDIVLARTAGSPASPIMAATPELPD